MSDGAKESVERPIVWFDACPHCGHHMNPVEKVKSERWGEYDWEIVCSSSHCRARMRIAADGWSEQLDAERNPHIPPDQLYRDRLTQLSRMWNRRASPPAAPAGGESKIATRADEDAVKDLVLKHCTVNERKVLLRTVWKDGIDIDRPRTCIMNIADDLLALAAAPAQSNGEPVGRQLDSAGSGPTDATDPYGSRSFAQANQE